MPRGAARGRCEAAFGNSGSSGRRPGNWKMLNEGRYASISEMAAAEKIERGYLGTVLQLTLLAPWVVETIVEGRQGDEVGLPGSMEEVDLGWRHAATI